MSYIIELPDGREVEVEDDVEPEQARQNIISQFPELFPDMEKEDEGPDYTLAEGAVEFAKAIPRGAVQTVGTGLEGLGAIGATAGQGIDAALGTDWFDPIEENELVKAGRSLNQAMDESFLGADPRLRETLPNQLGAGLGSVASFFLPGLGQAGLATKAFGMAGMGTMALLKSGTALGRTAGVVGATRFPLAMGVGAGEASQRLQAAKDAGIKVDPEIEAAAIAAGTLIGLTELAPVEFAMRRLFGQVALDSKLGLTILQRVGRGILQGFAEGGQEAVASILQDLTEKGLYNPEKEIAEGVSTEFGVGAFAGGIIQLALDAAIPGKMRAPPRPAVVPGAPPTTPETPSQQPIGPERQLPAPDRTDSSTYEAVYGEVPGIDLVKLVESRLARNQADEEFEEWKKLRATDEAFNEATKGRTKAQESTVSQVRVANENFKTEQFKIRELPKPLQDKAIAILKRRLPAPVKDKNIFEMEMSLGELIDLGATEAEVEGLYAGRFPETYLIGTTEQDVVDLAQSKNINTGNKSFDALVRYVTGTDTLAETSAFDRVLLRDVLNRVDGFKKPTDITKVREEDYSHENYIAAEDMVIEEGKFNAAKIGRETGLNPPAVRQIRDDMVTQGLITKRGNQYRATIKPRRPDVPPPVTTPPFNKFEGEVSRTYEVEQVPVKGQRGKTQPAVVARGYSDEAQINQVGRRVIDTFESEEEAQAAAQKMREVTTDAASTAEFLNQPDPTTDAVLREASSDAINEQRDRGRAAGAVGIDPNGSMVQRVKAALQKIAAKRGLAKVGVPIKLVDKITDYLENAPPGAEGTYTARTVVLAIDNAVNRIPQDATVEEIEDAVARNLAEVMDHEIFHALLESGVITEAEWKNLFKYVTTKARPLGLQKQGIGPREGKTYWEEAFQTYAEVVSAKAAQQRAAGVSEEQIRINAEQYIAEEAMAEAFRDWANNRSTVTGRPASIFQKIVRAIRELGKVFGASGVARAEDIFTRLESGEAVAETEARGDLVAQPGVTKFSISDISDPQYEDMRGRGMSLKLEFAPEQAVLIVSTGDRTVEVRGNPKIGGEYIGDRLDRVLDAIPRRADISSLFADQTAHLKPGWGDSIVDALEFEDEMQRRLFAGVEKAKYAIDPQGKKITNPGYLFKGLAKLVVQQDSPDTVRQVVSEDEQFVLEALWTHKGGDKPPTKGEIASVRKQLYDATQQALADYPDTMSVWRVGALDARARGAPAGFPASFTTNPDYNFRSMLPWVTDPEARLVEYWVEKKDILAAPNAVLRPGKGSDMEHEVVIAIGNVRPPDLDTKFSITPENLMAMTPEGRINQLKRLPVMQHFRGVKVADMLERAADPEDRVTIVLVSPDYYLTAATSGHRNPHQVPIYAENAAKGMRLDEFPHLSTTHEEGTDYIASAGGHNGRHRARALKRLGYDLIPVVIYTNSVRWGQTGMNERPSGLMGQDETDESMQDFPDSIAFPVEPGHSNGAAILARELNKPLGRKPHLIGGIAPDDDLLIQAKKIVYGTFPMYHRMDREGLVEGKTLEERLDDTILSRALPVLADRMRQVAINNGAEHSYLSGAWGQYKDFQEFAIGFESIFPAGSDMQGISNTAAEALMWAKANNQDAAYAAMEVPDDYSNLDGNARPGLTVFFYPVDPISGRAHDLWSVQNLVEDFSTKKIGGFTVFRSDEANNQPFSQGFQGMRFIWMPEYTMGPSRRVDDASLQEAKLEALDELQEIAHNIERRGTGSAQVSHYIAVTAERGNYDQVIEQLVTPERDPADAGPLGEHGPWRRSVGDSVEEAIERGRGRRGEADRFGDPQLPLEGKYSLSYRTVTPEQRQLRRWAVDVRRVGKSTITRYFMAYDRDDAMNKAYASPLINRAGFDLHNFREDDPSPRKYSLGDIEQYEREDDQFGSSLLRAIYDIPMDTNAASVWLATIVKPEKIKRKRIMREAEMRRNKAGDLIRSMEPTGEVEEIVIPAQPALKGTKLAEVRFLGLDQWLMKKGKDTVTKDQILNYIAKNNMPVIEEIAHEYEGWDNYRLHGGRNYRELVLAFPSDRMRIFGIRQPSQEDVLALARNRRDHNVVKEIMGKFWGETITFGPPEKPVFDGTRRRRLQRLPASQDEVRKQIMGENDQYPILANGQRIGAVRKVRNNRWEVEGDRFTGSRRHETGDAAMQAAKRIFFDNPNLTSVYGMTLSEEAYKKASAEIEEALTKDVALDPQNWLEVAAEDLGVHQDPETGKTVVTRDVRRSHHRTIANSFMHIRLADFTDAEGNKVLVIDEIQADWHQRGIYEGYFAGVPRVSIRTIPLAQARAEGLIDASLEEHIESFTDVDAEGNRTITVGSIRNFYAQKRNDNNDLVSDGVRDRKQVAIGRKGFVYDVVYNQTDAPGNFKKIKYDDSEGGSGVYPDAPFKNEWVQMGVRHALQVALDGGYDKIAWTTKEIQVDRNGSRAEDLFERVYEHITPQEMKRIGKPYAAKLYTEDALAEIQISEEDGAGGLVYDIVDNNGVVLNEIAYRDEEEAFEAVHEYGNWITGQVAEVMEGEEAGPTLFEEARPTWIVWMGEEGAKAKGYDGVDDYATQNEAQGEDPREEDRLKAQNALDIKRNLTPLSSTFPAGSPRSEGYVKKAGDDVILGVFDDKEAAEAMAQDQGWWLKVDNDEVVTEKFEDEDDANTYYYENHEPRVEPRESEEEAEREDVSLHAMELPKSMREALAGEKPGKFSIQPLQYYRDRLHPNTYADAMQTLRPRAGSQQEILGYVKTDKGKPRAVVAVKGYRVGSDGFGLKYMEPQEEDIINTTGMSLIEMLPTMMADHAAGKNVTVSQPKKGKSEWWEIAWTAPNGTLIQVALQPNPDSMREPENHGRTLVIMDIYRDRSKAIVEPEIKVTNAEKIIDWKREEDLSDKGPLGRLIPETMRELPNIEALRQMGERLGEPVHEMSVAFTTLDGVTYILSKNATDRLGIDRDLILAHEANIPAANRMIEEDREFADLLFEAAELGDSTAVKPGTIQYLKRFQLGPFNRATQQIEVIAHELALQELDVVKGKDAFKERKYRYSLDPSQAGNRIPGFTPEEGRVAEMDMTHTRVDGIIGGGIHKVMRTPAMVAARQKLQDKMLPVEMIIEEVRKNGGSITDATNIYLQEQLYHGRTIEAIRRKETALYFPLLEEIKATKGITMEDVEDFMVAHHASERNKEIYNKQVEGKIPNPQTDGSGISNADAAQVLADFQTEGKTAELERLAAMGYAIIEDTNRVRLEGHLIDQHVINASPYSKYIPLIGNKEEDFEEDPIHTLYRDKTKGKKSIFMRTGARQGIMGLESKRPKGRRTPAVDVLGHIFMQNEEAVIRSERNRIIRSFGEFVRTNAGVNIGKEGEALRDYVEIIDPGSEFERVNDGNTIKLRRNTTYKGEEDVISYKEITENEDGTKSVKQVSMRLKDERLVRAMKGAVTPETMGTILTAMTRINRFLASVNTSWNPEFIVSNLFRDLQTAAIVSMQFDIPGLTTEILATLPASLRGIEAVLREGKIKSPLASENEFATAFREMQEVGGTTEFLGIRDLNSTLDRIKNEIAQVRPGANPKKMLKHFRNLGRFIEDYNKIAENGVRLAAYKALTKRGVSKDQAAFVAKNLTVNFNKGGTAKALANGMYLFYNATIQGSWVLVNSLRSRRVRRAVAGVVAAGFLLDALGSMMGDDDEDGRSEYDEVDDFVKERNIVLMNPTGGPPLLIPMPYGFNSFFNLGRVMSAYSRGEMKGMDATSSAVMTFVESFNPLGGSESFVNFVAPTLFDPIIDIAANRDFADRPIVPERMGVGNPQSQLYWNNTNPAFVKTAEWLNMLGGGSEIRPSDIDMLDISPNVMEYWFDYALGGMGTFVMRSFGQTPQNLIKAIEGDWENVDVNNIVFLRKVVGSAGNVQDRRQYYDNAYDVKLAMKEYDHFVKKGDVEEVKRVRALYAPQLAVANVFKAIDRQLTDRRERLKKVRENPRLTEKAREKLEERIQADMDVFIDQANRLYNTRVSGK